MIVLPYPPSANRIWRNVVVKGKPRTLKSATYRAWQQEAVLACRGAEKVHEPYHLAIFADRPDRRARDIGNIEKAVSDILQAAGVIRNDCDAISIYLRWEADEPVKAPKVRVRVYADPEEREAA